jgi:hypothetical protein
MSNGSVIWTDHHGNKSADGRLDSMHRFERVGLGKAPFRVRGFGREVYQAVPGDPNCPLQPGTSCDYCGTGIMDVAYVESADGKRFKVGCDCVAKAGDGGLLTAIRRSPQYRELQRQKRHAKDEANKAELQRLLADPRLQEYRRESFDYRLKWCGAAGRARVLRELRDELSRV